MIDKIISFVLQFVQVFSLTQWLGIFTTFVILYVYNFYTNIIWKKLNVPYLTPLPLVGNDFNLALGVKTIQDHQIEKYRKFGSEKFGGVYNLISPVLFVKDTRLVEAILTTDFSHFPDRGIPIDEKREPLTGHLFSLSGKKWKNLRHKLSPVFTSGKLKTMHHQLIDCADVLVHVLNSSCEKNRAVDFKETMAQFTTDVIGSCAYGLDMNSLKDPDNEFRAMGKKIFMPSAWRKLKAFLFFVFLSISPKLTFMMRIRPFPRDVEKFFLRLVPDMISMREKNPQYNRNDFIQLLMQLRQQDAQKQKSISEGNTELDTSNDVHLDDNLMAANSFLFFVAGFETTASTLAYCLFELANHTDIQEKLYQEVQEVLAKHENQPTYDAIKQLHYMDMVISETLRKYPPVPLLMRVCTENYRIPDSDVVLPKGTRVEIPVYALHHDPEIYPDPEDFRPLRFSPENKDSIPKGAYLPFGDGPRICIGARFAQMEIKVCLSKILSKFHVLRTPGLPRTIEFNPKSQFILVPKTEILLQLSAR